MPKEAPAGAEMRLPHIAARLFDEPLLLHPRKLHTIVNVLAPRLFSGAQITEAMREAAQDNFLAEHGPAVNPGHHAIAVIPIHGTLVQRGDSMDAASGLLSYEAIRADFDEAMARADVDAVLFDIDSGGGEASGVFDLVDYIASRRGEKPVYAFANEHAYSAAYALAAAADKIFLPRTGGVGSIGVVAVHLDQSGFDEKAGMSYTPVFSGARKIDGWPHAPLSKEAQARMQARVETVYEIFTQTVARLRNLSEQEIIATEADCFDGENAVKAGLADGVTSFDEAVEIILRDIEQRAARQVSGPVARESHSGLFGETTSKEGKKTMSLKNLVMGRSSRKARRKADNPDDEKETGEPIDKEEAEDEEDREDELESGPDDEEEIYSDEDDEDEDFIEEDEDDEFLEDDEEEKPSSRKGRASARKESLEIMALCRLYGNPGLAEGYIRKGYSAKHVRKRLLNKRNHQLKAAPNHVISNRQSSRVHSGAGGVVAAVKQKLGMKE